MLQVALGYPIFAGPNFTKKLLYIFVYLYLVVEQGNIFSLRVSLQCLHLNI